MEKLDAQSALAAAVEEVLETMCFTLLLSSSALSGPEAAVPGAGFSNPVTAVLQFEGSPSGEFRLSVPLTVARGVGSGFLGREPGEVSDCQAGEVVCELANMFCGSVLSRLEAETIFHLSHPELAHPELAHPELAHPELAHPELAHPELAHPELAHPELMPAVPAPDGNAVSRLFELEDGFFAASLQFRLVS